MKGQLIDLQNITNWQYFVLINSVFSKINISQINLRYLEECLPLNSFCGFWLSSLLIFLPLLVSFLKNWSYVGDLKKYGGFIFCNWIFKAWLKILSENISILFSHCRWCRSFVKLWHFSKSKVPWEFGPYWHRNTKILFSFYIFLQFWVC